MTVATVQNRKKYTGSGDTYSIPFPFTDTGQIEVYLDQGTEGNWVLLDIATDYSIAGTDVVLTTPISGSDEIYLIRSTVSALLQPTEVPFNDPLPSSFLETFMDEFTFLAQEAQDGANRSVSGSVTMPLPEAGKLVYAEDGELTNKALSELDGDAYTGPLAVTNGGTGGTSQATARSGLGIGSAATKDAGVREGRIPILASGGMIDRARLQQISVTDAGVPPTYGPINGVYVAGEGWDAGIPLITPLVEVDETSGTSHDAAGDISWDDYDDIVVYGAWQAGNAADDLRIRLDIDGTWRTGASDYTYAGNHVRTVTAPTQYQSGQISAGYIEAFPSTAISPTTDFGIAKFKIVISQNGDYPHLRCVMTHAGGTSTPLYRSDVSGRVKVTGGSVRGIRFISNTGAFSILKAKVYGLTRPSF